MKIETKDQNGKIQFYQSENVPSYQRWQQAKESCAILRAFWNDMLEGSMNLQGKIQCAQRADQMRMMLLQIKLLQDVCELGEKGPETH